MVLKLYSKIIKRKMAWNAVFTVFQAIQDS